jgi:hypothetical protein
MLDRAGPFLRPYVEEFVSPFRAMDELFADLAAVEGMLSNGYELDEAVDACDRHWEEIMDAWTGGLRADELLTAARKWKR